MPQRKDKAGEAVTARQGAVRSNPGITEGQKQGPAGPAPCVSTLPACLQSRAADFEQELQQTSEKSNVNDLFYLNYHQERSQQICKYLLTKVIKD